MATHGHAHGDHAIPVAHTHGEHHHSGPGHEHEHGSGPSHDFAAANRAYFDEHAHEIEHMHPHAHSLAVKEVEAMRRAWPELFDEERTVAMDYACGTGASVFGLALPSSESELRMVVGCSSDDDRLFVGMVSQQLCQYVKSVVGVDISQASVDRYNTQASNQGLAPEEMHAVCVELTGDPQENELDGARFDLIVVRTITSMWRFSLIIRASAALSHPRLTNDYIVLCVVSSLSFY